MGLVGGQRQYDGPGLGVGPWKCPSCGGANTAEMQVGCQHCGSGSAQPRHVGQAPPVAPPADLHLPSARWTGFKSAEEHAAARVESGAFQAVKADMDHGVEVYTAAATWAATHETVPAAEAFIAGYEFAVQQLTARTMLAPPVTADLAELAPDGKARRTIIAALDLFKDQVLRDARDEIASGEWCSLEEVEQLIIDLKTQEPDLKLEEDSQ